MMIQNAAFIPDAFPASPGGTATTAAPSGAAGFQQLLEGRQVQNPSQTKTEAKQPATGGRPARDAGAKAEELPDGTAAQQQAAVTTDPRDGAVSGKRGSLEEAATSGEDATSADLVRSARDNVQVQGASPDPNPGLVVATAQLASHQEETGAAKTDAGAQALSRLEALQERLPQGPEADGLPGAAQEVKQAANPEAGQETKQAVKPGNSAESRLTGEQQGQKAEPTELPRNERGAVVIPSMGATEGAQVEKPQAPQASEAAAHAAHTPVLPDAAKTSGAASQTTAAERLSARQQGEGRFVAMPVRNLSGGTAETATAEAQHVSGEAVTGNTPGTQGDASTPAMTTVEAGTATREATVKEAALQVKTASGDEKAQGAAGAETQPAKASADADPATGKSQQHREMRHSEAATGREGRVAEQALQADAAKGSGEEVSGAGRATPAAVKLAPETGVREASEGRNGDTQHKGEQQNGQMFGASAVAHGNTAEAVPAEARQSQARTPLHESILAQVKEGVVSHDGKGNGQMSIRLNPGELGELKIQVRMDNNRLHVEVQADNRMVKDLLLGNLDSLKEALSGKNLTMDGFNVSTGGSGFNGPLNEDRGNQRQQQSQRFARGMGYDGQEAPRVNYLTAEVNTLLDVRF